MSAASVRVCPTSVASPLSTYDLYCRSGPERSCSDTGTTACVVPPPLTRTALEVTAGPLLGTHRQAYVPPATVATSARVVPGARPSTSPYTALVAGSTRYTSDVL